MSEIPLQQTTRAATLPEITWNRPGTGGFSPRLVIAALLSVLVPGAGHLLIGERRKGLVLLGVSIASALLVVAIVPREPFAALAMFTQPRNLGALLIADLALMLFRVYAVVDVVRSGKPRSERHAGTLLAVALLVAMTAAPHVAVAYYDIVTYQFLEEVFDNDSSPPQAVAPGEVQLTREVRLADGVVPAAPPVVAPANETGVPDESSNP